jgi:cytochrome c oxidase subunit II
METVFQTASPQAGAISDLFRVLLLICGAILAVVTVLVIYCGIRFRFRPAAPEPVRVFGNRKLEFAWTLIPFLLLVWIFILTARTMAISDPSPRGDPDLIVAGHQWWWEARYPRAGVTTANEIHIPTGRKLLVRLESADVIHDFWVPRLARKMDMVPGQPNFLWLEADQAGVYRGACSEFCGTQHAWMRFEVWAQSPAEFADWLDRQGRPPAAPSDPAAVRGAQLFQSRTCVNCHPIAGTSAQAHVAPDLAHLADRHTLAAGLLPNTVENLRRWLINPQTVKPGCLMPNLNLTESQARDLAHYLEGPL